MSDTSQGPGWWQASDGRWYPPEQHPDYQAPTQPAPPAPARPQEQPPAEPPGPQYSPYGTFDSPGTPGYAPPFPAMPTPPARGSRVPLIVAVAVVLFVVAAGAVFFLGRDSGGSTASFCKKVHSLKSDSDLGNAFDDPSKLDAATAQIQALTDAAPKEIKPDMQTVNDFFKQLVGAVKNAGGDKEKQASALVAMALAADQKKIEAATQHIENFTRDNCGTSFTFGSETSTFDSDFGSFSFSSDFSFSQSFGSALSDLESSFFS